MPFRIFNSTGRLAGFASLWTSACVTAPVYSTASAGTVLTIVDNASAQEFELSVKNRGSRSVCIPEDYWPNARGQVVVGHNAVLSFVGGSLFAPSADFGFIVCPHRQCSEIHVPPGGEVTAKIGYSVFGEASSIASLRERRLTFTLPKRMC